MDQSKVAGPGAIAEQGVLPVPLLEGATEYEVVEVFNPLPVDFIGQVGQSKPVNLPFEARQDGMTNTITRTEGDIRNNYGLDLKNKDHVARMPIVNKIMIPAGSTIRMLGNEAQVIVRQLVTDILQREGKRLMLADPYQRHTVEKRVVRSRRGVQDALGDVPQTVQDQLRDSVRKLNEQENEQEFPELNTPKASGGPSQGSNDRGVEASPRKVRTDDSK